MTTHNFLPAPATPGPNFIATLLGALYSPRWEDKRQNFPTPGAQSYAWETYQLPAFTFIGAGTHALNKRLHAFYSAPLWSQPAFVMQGVPRIAGQFILQPLVNPLQSGP